ncbi:hypothetical protein C5B91_14435 [Haloferax sp. Atlit-10N]|uniref:hypothetical protein n=1 Tax=unclassified Haloferax TaxID=2625095 RepID=UPI000E21C71A|nr:MULTISPECIES: hypothetical protein [unclassified Haloferax]RDZ43316.1 hypothetical protein C5B87_15265 [Haloferax sp. Atlit-16N]RDZ57890.1 hypothetical protein C5B91_14435 [Haloferax sp. Atlit-10N]
MSRVTAVVRELRPDDSLPSEATELGRLGLFLACLTVASAASYWVALRLRGVPIVGTLASPNVAGLAVPTLVYARYRGVSLSFGPPERSRLGDAAATALAPALAVIAASVLFAVGFDASLAALLGWTYHPEASVATAAVRTAEDAALTGLGFGILVAAVFDLASSRVGLSSARAVATTAALATFFHSVLRDAAFTLVVFPKPWRVGVVSLLLVATVCGCVAAGVTYRGVVERSIRPLSRPTLAPAFAFGLFAVAALGTVFADVPGGVEHALWSLAFGVAALGFGRSKSAWVPAATMALFSLSIRLVGFVELALL